MIESTKDIEALYTSSCHATVE